MRSSARRILAGLIVVAFIGAGDWLSAQADRQRRPPIQPSIIEGRVRLGGDPKMTNPPFIQIYREGELLQEALADLDGNFKFQNLSPGLYKIVVRLTGFKEIEQEVEIIGRGGITRRLMLEMQPEPVSNAIGATPTVSVAELRIPDKADKEYRKGKDDLRNEKYANAIKHFRKAIEIYPAFPQVHSDLGLACQRSGDLAGAEQAFLACLKVDPAFLFARLNLAELYISTGRRDEARQLIEETAALHPEAGQAHLALGKLYLDDGQLEQAEAACRRAAELPETSSDVYMLLAKIYLKQNRFPELVQALEDYLAKDPTGPYAEQVRQTLTQVKKK
jgi:Flp pilus assembly protein TadD